jgi:hypothetical protein
LAACPLNAVQPSRLSRRVLVFLGVQSIPPTSSQLLDYFARSWLSARQPWFEDLAPILAEPGEGDANRLNEFVVRQGPAQQFGPLLSALNAGSAPSVTNNAHTFTFNVNGAGSPEQTAKEIAGMLRRGVRRGLFTLS